MSLPNYDTWKTHNPADDCCEFCGASPHETRRGWQPEACTGECGRVWRDPDAMHEECEENRRHIWQEDYE